jgi:hypothetical protein
MLPVPVPGTPHAVGCRFSTSLLPATPPRTGAVSTGKPLHCPYPTVPVPAASPDGWLDLVPEGYEGNALADTEALYDEV